MLTMSVVTAVVIALLGAQHAVAASQDTVTCGSMLQLEHSASKFRLHSHEVKYGHQHGSHQQSVTLFQQSTDANNNFLIEGAYGEDCRPGTAVERGQKIRFKHIATNTYLHSHLFKSPLSGNQEVSAFDESDSGDNWIVEPMGGNEWKRDSKVRFKHADTHTYLHATGRHQYGHPIAGQREVSAYGSANNFNAWIAREGVYLHPSSDADTDSSSGAGVVKDEL